MKLFALRSPLKACFSELTYFALNLAIEDLKDVEAFSFRISARCYYEQLQ